MNRHRDEAFAIAFVQLRGQSSGLSAKHENDVVALIERRIPEQPSRFRREEPRLAKRRELALEHLPARPHPQVDVLPVVESRALHLAFVEREAERLDEM